MRRRNPPQAVLEDAQRQSLVVLADMYGDHASVDLVHDFAVLVEHMGLSQLWTRNVMATRDLERLRGLLLEWSPVVDWLAAEDEVAHELALREVVTPIVAAVPMCYADGEESTFLLLYGQGTPEYDLTFWTRFSPRPLYRGHRRVAPARPTKIPRLLVFNVEESPDITGQFAAEVAISDVKCDLRGKHSPRVWSRALSVCRRDVAKYQYARALQLFVPEAVDATGSGSFLHRLAQECDPPLTATFTDMSFDNILAWATIFALAREFGDVLDRQRAITQWAAKNLGWRHGL